MVKLTFGTKLLTIHFTYFKFTVMHFPYPFSPKWKTKKQSDPTPSRTIYIWTLWSRDAQKTKRATQLETDGQTDRQTDRQIDRLKNRQTERRTWRQTDRQTEGQMDRETEGQRDRWTGRQGDRLTERQKVIQRDGQTDRQTDTQTKRRTDGQTDRQTDTHTNRRTVELLLRIWQTLLVASMGNRLCQEMEMRGRGEGSMILDFVMAEETWIFFLHIFWFFSFFHLPLYSNKLTCSHI